MQFEIHEGKYYHQGEELADPAMYVILDAYGDAAKGCRAIFAEFYSSPGLRLGAITIIRDVNDAYLCTIKEEIYPTYSEITIIG